MWSAHFMAHLGSFVAGHAGLNAQTQDKPLDYEEKAASPSFCCVSALPPYRLLDISPECMDLVQYSREETQGKTLDLICGPATVTARLHKAISDASSGTETTMHTFLYSSSGNPFLSVVRVARGAHSDSIQLDIRQSNAMFEESVPVSDTPSLTVAYDESHFVLHASSSFQRCFGFRSAEMSATGLAAIFGPATDVSHFSGLLQNARSGLSQTSSVLVYARDGKEIVCNAHIVPVLDAQFEALYLRISLETLSALESHRTLFEPPSISPMDISASLPWDTACAPSRSVSMVSARTHSMPLDSYPARTQSMTVSNSPSAHSTRSRTASSSSRDRASSSATTRSTGGEAASLLDPRATSFVTALPGPPSSAGSHVQVDEEEEIECASPTSQSGSSVSACGEPAPGETSSSVWVIPRRKAAGADKLAAPVELSVQMLRDMGACSMREASFALGIAPSTLKKACRRLGIKRWLHSTAPAQTKIVYQNEESMRLVLDGN